MRRSPTGHFSLTHSAEIRSDTRVQDIWCGKGAHSRAAPVLVFFELLLDCAWNSLEYSVPSQRKVCALFQVLVHVCVQRYETAIRQQAQE